MYVYRVTHTINKEDLDIVLVTTNLNTLHYDSLA